MLLDNSVPDVKGLNSRLSQIYYCSRTHSQLTQFVQELRKTAYADELRLVSLGSRRNLCINDQVRALGSIARMNESCLEMQKSGKYTILSRKDAREYHVHVTDCSRN
jgi:hypothetical protein